MFKARSKFKPSELRKRRNERRNWKAAVFSVIALVALGAAIFALNYRKFLISSVEIFGVRLADASSLRASVEKELEGRYWLIIPKKSIFFYPFEKIEKAALRSFKELKAVSANVRAGRVLKIEVDERKPLSPWCGRTYAESAEAGNGPCYFFDEGGMLYMESPSFSGNMFVKYYGPVGTGEPDVAPLGQTFVGAPTISDLVSFAERLRSETLFKPVAVSAGESERFDIHLAGGGAVIVSSRQPFEKTFENLSFVLKESEIGELTQKGKELDYIDMRFGNKIFYRFK